LSLISFCAKFVSLEWRKRAQFVPIGISMICWKKLSSKLDKYVRDKKL
jgi:hypothetical protein